MIEEIHFIELKNVPIFEQLRLEEALLRTETRNFCIVNFGSPPAIVMGISGKKEELVHLDLLAQKPIPLLKRFSGGGTVVIDENTLFITFIFSKKAHSFPLFPEPIHQWAAELYREAWGFTDFSFKENDYVLGDRKCGGNAQYITKDRWLHHTSFLWKFREENMSYLKMPPKRPHYRLNRSHKDFLCSLSTRAASPNELIIKLKAAIVKRLYISDFDLSSWEEKPHRRGTELIIGPVA